MTVKDDEIPAAVQAQLDELQAEIDRQRAEIAADREERESAARAKANPSKAKRSLTRAVPRENPYDLYDAANPEDTFEKRWAGSGALAARDTMEELERGDLEAIARRLRVEPEFIPAVVVETLYHVRFDPGGWRTGPKADYLDTAGLEKVMKKALKELEAREEEPQKATYSIVSGAPDYSKVMPKRRSASTPFVEALFHDAEKDRTLRHAKQMADGLKADQEASERQKRTREEEEATSGATLPMSAILGTR